MSLQAFTAFFTHISFDWIILILCASVLTFDALRSGLSRVTALALALPLTLLLLEYAQNAQFMTSLERQLSSPASRLIFDAALLIVLCIIMYRITDTFAASSYHLLQALIGGIAATAIVIIVWLQIPALDSVWHFGPQVQAIFGATYRFWWCLAAFIGLAFARG